MCYTLLRLVTYDHSDHSRSERGLRQARGLTDREEVIDWSCICKQPPSCCLCLSSVSNIDDGAGAVSEVRYQGDKQHVYILYKVGLRFQGNGGEEKEDEYRTEFVYR